MRGLTLFTARYSSRCNCGEEIIPGDTVSRVYGRSRAILCHRCTRRARGVEAEALDHRIEAARAGHATKPRED